MLKIIEDLCSAIAGNAKTRINDPFIGTFICSWIACNWNNLALLFWGEGKPWERISAFYIYLSYTPFWEFNRLFFVPLVIALFYLFAFPWISLLIKFFQHWANEKLHQQAVGSEKLKIEQQEELKKASLRLDQNKPFLEQLVQQDVDEREKLIQQKIDKENTVLEQKKLRTELFEAKAKEARDKAKQQENEAKAAQLELEKKQKQAELDKIRFEKDSAIARATLASHRFPSAYSLMSQIEASLKEDGIVVSLNTSGKIVAALFGYDNFESLLDDKKFNNETLDQVRYVYYDDELAKRLEQIVLDEDSENEEFNADLLFGKLDELVISDKFELVSGETLAEYSKEIIENDPYEIFNGDGTSGAIAESDTIFEDVEDLIIEQFELDKAFYTVLSASASGEHRSGEGIPGRTMTLSIKMKCSLLVGKFGLGEIEIDDITGKLDDYD